MAIVQELYNYLDEVIPRSLSCSWDNDGLMLCPNPFEQVNKVLLALDATDEVAEYAVENGFDVIVTHHPMIFSPLSSLSASDPIPRRAMYLAKNGVSVMSFHTRLDARTGGVNDMLAKRLGIISTVPFGPEGEKLGRFGVLSKPMEFRMFCGMVSEALGTEAITAIGENKEIQRVAVLGGGGKDFVHSAIECGADVFVTGEVTYSVMLDAKSRGLCLVCAGHYHTEVPVLESLGGAIRERFPNLFIKKYPKNTEVFIVK